MEQHPHARANVLRLAAAQALAGGNATVVYATGAVVGAALAPSPALATLPVSVFVLGMAACTLPAGRVARLHGRRAAFMLGTGCGIAGGLVCALAVWLSLFPLFCLGTFLGGAYAAVVLSFRFAAADCVGPEGRARALSLVMAGGVFAGVIGPQLVSATMGLLPPFLFLPSFLAQSAVAVVCALVLSGVRLPRPVPQAGTAAGRPLAVIARQPRFGVAVCCGVVSYFLMNFVMTSAPLAMHMCGLPLRSANLGLQWHVLAMYGPSFVTGRLIGRFGAQRVVACGLVLTACAAATGLSGMDVAHFWGTLVLLGLGWNLGFVGASALVLECHRPEERTRVQSLNDFLVFGTMACGSFASGGLLTRWGWDAVCLAALPPLAVAATALVLGRRQAAVAA